MDATTAIAATGTSQTATQNPQDIGTQSLIPTMASLQPGAATTGDNLNTSASTAIAIPLDSISTGTVKSAQIVKKEPSTSPYLLGFGAVIIVSAIFGLVISNILSSHRLAID